MKEVKVFLLLGTCVKFFVKEVKVLLGTCVKFTVKFNVRVIKIILFYKVKEGACKRGRVDSGSGVCVGEVSVGR